MVEATVNNIMQGVIHYKCDATNNNAIASVLVLRQHVRREAVIIIILLVVTTTVKVLERFQQFKNACNSFVGRVFPNLQQKCYFYDNIGNARISKAPGPAPEMPQPTTLGTHLSQVNKENSVGII